ncbi:MAG: cytidylate kinase family protein [Patescibacteria group bacterium]|jgi:predicted cytidylate kinase
MTTYEALAFIKTIDPLRITVSGDIGSGKSTFTTHLAEALDLPRISIGDFMREEAIARGITLTELGAEQEKNDELDRKMDAKQHERSQEVNRGIFEGRTSWHFVVDPKIRVFLAVDPLEGAKRVLADSTNPKREHFETLEEVKAANERRKQSEITRYQTYYHIDIFDPKNFDVFINTTPLSVHEVFEKTVVSIANYLKKPLSS